jgi:hypothetical protein
MMLIKAVIEAAFAGISEYWSPEIGGDILDLGH